MADFGEIDFEGVWEETDWERFFDAQDRLASERKVGLPQERPGVDPSLSFRRVMRSFGMDPDNPESSPRPFSIHNALSPDGSHGLPFWHPGADPERLPLFLQSAEFSRRVQELVEFRFRRVMTKTYVSGSHRQFQKALSDLHDRARAVPILVAMGHKTGYDPFGVKGNIVRCRQALNGVEECVGAFSKISPRLLGPTLHRDVLSECLRLRNALVDWVTLLRTRFVPPSRRCRPSDHGGRP